MNKEFQYLIEKTVIINLYFNHKIDFLTLADALRILDEKYAEIVKSSQLAITM